MRERAIRRNAELEARELRPAQVEGNHPARILRQQRERVVPGRRDRQARVPGPHVECFEEDIRILPRLRVADDAEVGALGNFATHAPPRSRLATTAPPPGSAEESA